MQANPRRSHILMCCRPQLSLTADHRRCREKAHCGIRWPCAADKRNKSTGSAPGTFSISPGRCLVARPAVCHTLLGCARPSGVAGRGRDARCDRRGERPAGMMLAGELALAGVALRSWSDARQGNWRNPVPAASIPAPSSSSTSVGSPIGSWRRERRARRPGSAARFWISATFRRGTRTGLACGRADAADPRGLDRPARRDRSPRTRGGRFRPGRIRRRCRSRRWPENSGGVPCRRRRGPQHGPQERGHRLPWMGRDPQQPDCRSPGIRGAAVRHASG